MNKVILSGNVGADPQFKQTEKTAVCNFRIAVNDKFKNDSPPTWFTITTFGKSAEFAHSYIKKGTNVLVEGKIQLDEVEKDGVKRLFVSVISDNVELIGNKSESPAASNGLEDNKDLPF